MAPVLETSSLPCSLGAVGRHHLGQERLQGLCGPSRGWARAWAAVGMEHLGSGNTVGLRWQATGGLLDTPALTGRGDLCLGSELGLCPANLLVIEQRSCASSENLPKIRNEKCARRKRPQPSFFQPQDRAPGCPRETPPSRPPGPGPPSLCPGRLPCTPALPAQAHLSFRLGEWATYPTDVPDPQTR